VSARVVAAVLAVLLAAAVVVGVVAIASLRADVAERDAHVVELRGELRDLGRVIANDQARLDRAEREGFDK
jgi:hypothetical protein